jgi:hypothetical protein
MLTLSNDPPTLDRESTKHRYSKLLKEMIDSCLQKDPTKRQALGDEATTLSTFLS